MDLRHPAFVAQIPFGMLNDQRAVAAALHQHQVEDDLLAEGVCPLGQCPQLGAADELDEGLAAEGLFRLGRRQSGETFQLAGAHETFRLQRPPIHFLGWRNERGVDLEKVPHRIDAAEGALAHVLAGVQVRKTWAKKGQ